MILESYLNDRDDRLARARAQEERDAAARAWMMGGVSPAARLLRFDRWVRLELGSRLDWAWAGEAKDRRIQQCRIELESMLVAMDRRGWQLDGRRLAGHITDALDDVAAAQRAGRVKDFWPFFQSVVRRYVGLNAEELQAEAMSVGAHAGQVFQRLAKQLPAEPTIPALVAQRRQETLQEQLRRERAKEATKKANADQPQLF